MSRQRERSLPERSRSCASIRTGHRRSKSRSRWRTGYSQPANFRQETVDCVGDFRGGCWIISFRAVRFARVAGRPRVAFCPWLAGLGRCQNPPRRHTRWQLGSFPAKNEARLGKRNVGRSERYAAERYERQSAVPASSRFQSSRSRFRLSSSATR